MEAFEKVIEAVKALDSKKAFDIQVIKIDSVSSLGDYLVIASGGSTTQVRTLADEVEFRLSQLGEEPHHVEGRATGWIVLDYLSVMVHVFLPKQREFYALSHMWQDGEDVDVTEYLEEGRE